jgi:hypothetical protein
VPSTITTPVATRIPNEQAAELREQATRRGVTVSALVARLVDAELRGAGGEDTRTATDCTPESR